MSGIKISELTSASSISKDAVLPAVDGGNTYKVAMTTLLDYFYPVGTIYESTSLTTVTAVQNKFGGTWEVFGAGRVLVGVDTADTDFNTVNATGGEKVHTLTIDETPKHTHTRGTMEIEGSMRVALMGITDMEVYNASGAIQPLETKTIKWGSNDAVTGLTDNRTANINLKASENWTGATSEVGGGQSHNNLQPYVTVYRYRRTA